jgi:hypothetical protein
MLVSGLGLIFLAQYSCNMRERESGGKEEGEKSLVIFWALSMSQIYLSPESRFFRRGE